MSAFIDLAEAITMTATYRLKRPAILDPTVPVETLPICETFSKEHVQTLLNHGECVQLRAYFAMDEKHEIKIILVGVDANDTDIFIGDNVLLDRAARCPVMCPPSSPLNV